MIAKIRIWARDYQPARATAILGSLIALAGVLGYGQLATDLTPTANAVLGVIGAVVVLLSGERTRTQVWSPATLAGDLDLLAGDHEMVDSLDADDLGVVSDEEADELGLDDEDDDRAES